MASDPRRQQGAAGPFGRWPNGWGFDYFYGFLGGDSGQWDHTVPIRFSAHAGMDIGRDNGGVVDLSYEDKKPFAFTGTVKKVVFDVKPHLSAQDEEALHAVAQHGHRRPDPAMTR